MREKALRSIECCVSSSQASCDTERGWEDGDERAISCKDSPVGDTHTPRADWKLGFWAGVGGTTSQFLRNLLIF